MIIYTRIRKLHGFSLVELLVVIAIIALLAAILFPIYTNARATASRAKCQSNLKQIGQAFSLYLADWNSVYPNTNDPYLWLGRRWRWPLRKYLALTANRDPDAPDDPHKSVGNVTGGVLICPSDTSARQMWDSTSYAYSAAFFHTPEQINTMTTAQLWNPSTPGPVCMPQSASEVIYPSKKAMVADWLSNHSDEKVTWWSWQGSRNYLFADGHVQHLAAGKIKPAVNGFPDINLTVDGIRGKDKD